MLAVSRRSIALDSGWEALTTEAGAFSAPAAVLEEKGWIEADVPGTVALARQRAGQWSITNPQPLHHLDHWYRTRVDVNGSFLLMFDGLATDAEVWLNTERILTSHSMFQQHAVEITSHGNDVLVICFRALKALLGKSLKRARWRPAMIFPSALRGVRTTLLGHMSGWCPDVHAIGPWRPVVLLPKSEPHVTQLRITTQLNPDYSAVLEVALSLNTNESIDGLMIDCANSRAKMIRQADGTFAVLLKLSYVEPWWPHTHGTPHLYDVELSIGNSRIHLGKVGFRTVEIDRGIDGQGFAVVVNGTKIFCRGACWTSADVVGLNASRATYQPWLELMRDANMNMVRVGGTMVYEGDDFYKLCDELGIMVWQDFMFANFDYPDSDPGFMDDVRIEASQFLTRTQCSPCITIVCGGSEVSQQAAMLGLPKEAWTSKLFAELLPDVCRSLRSDVPYVPNSPSGGDLPFIANAGVAHYYGVGAYQRSLDDVRRAAVRFASECLAFANVPETATLNRELPVPAVHHPLWKQRVPRDQGASWDFEDIRDFYLNLIFKVDVALLRRTDPQRYISLSQAVTGEVMEAVFAEWRRNKSTCWGGLVWTFQDLMPGAGWGVVDSTLQPKPAWYALRRAFRPVQLVMTDEGVNGLAVHAINDTTSNLKCRLTIKLFKGSSLMHSGSIDLQVQARSAVEVSATSILSRFVDINYAYRFGPLAHDVVVAELSAGESDDILAQAFYFPAGIDIQPKKLDWNVSVEKEGETLYLQLQSKQLATGVHIEDENFRTDDNWFHLAPGQTKRLKLIARTSKAFKPDGEIRALNGDVPSRFRGAD